MFSNWEVPQKEKEPLTRCQPCVQTATEKLYDRDSDSVICLDERVTTHD